jgi:four helix bundle protein
VSKNIIEDKSFQFAVRIVNLYKYLTADKKEYVMSKQILRCGTSIGANLAEAEYAITKKDFLSKIYIALKEASETRYWLQLLYDTKYLEKMQYQSLLRDCEELLRILSATTNTLTAELCSKE